MPLAKGEGDSVDEEIVEYCAEMAYYPQMGWRGALTKGDRDAKIPPCTSSNRAGGRGRALGLQSTLRCKRVICTQSYGLGRCCRTLQISTGGWLIQIV